LSTILSIEIDFLKPEMAQNQVLCGQQELIFRINKLNNDQQG
jgi:hypothetical protein